MFYQGLGFILLAELVLGFDNDMYKVREDAGPRASVSVINGDPGAFQIRLTVGTDDSYANATAGGNGDA